MRRPKYTPTTRTKKLIDGNVEITLLIQNNKVVSFSVNMPCSLRRVFTVLGKEFNKDFSKQIAKSGGLVFKEARCYVLKEGVL